MQLFDFFNSQIELVTVGIILSSREDAPVVLSREQALSVASELGREIRGAFQLVQ